MEIVRISFCRFLLKTPVLAATGLQDLMRVLTEYEEGAGPKQDILKAEDDEMEVDATGGGASYANGSDSKRLAYTIAHQSNVRVQGLCNIRCNKPCADATGGGASDAEADADSDGWHLPFPLPCLSRVRIPQDWMALLSGKLCGGALDAEPDARGSDSASLPCLLRPGSALIFVRQCRCVVPDLLLLVCARARLACAFVFDKPSAAATSVHASGEGGSGSDEDDDSEEAAEFGRLVERARAEVGLSWALGC